MVFFSCDGCGDMLKKNQVDTHVHRCKVGCHAVSCVDCSVSFHGDDYRTHTSCVTEAERYEKTVYRGPRKGEPAGKSRKMTPQEAWNHVIASAAESAPQPIRRHVEQLAAMDNVPRKERQFRNFAVNSLRLRGRDANEAVDAVWKHLSGVREEEQKRSRDRQATRDGEQKRNDSAQSGAGKSVGGDGSSRDAESAAAAEPSGGEEEKRAEEPRGSASEIGGKSGGGRGTAADLCPRLVKKTMKKVLKKAPNRTMKMKKLRREVKTRLMLKGLEKELKKVVAQQIGVSSKKIKVDGKLVTLLG